MEDIQTRADRVREFLRNREPIVDQSSRTAAQETYVKKLHGDIERTRAFLEQAKLATTKLRDELAVPNPDWDPTTQQQAHIVALFESYRKLPYMAMKNDLIGIATAASLTKRAVSDQRHTSGVLAAENEVLEREMAKNAQVLADYEEIDELIKQRVQLHPERMAKIRAKLHESQPLEAEMDRKLQSVQNATAAYKSVEDQLYQHVKRVVTKIHAAQDWENANIMDEQTFKSSVVLSISLIVTLVSNLLLPTEKWVTFTPGGPEEKVLLVMVRNQLVVVRDNLEVKLRDFGFE